MVKVLIVFTLVFLSESILAQNPISFPEEHIDFSLDSNYFSINGIYSFRNNSNKIVNQPIAFPFADDVKNIDSIRVLCLSNMRNIEFLGSGKFISFNLLMSPHDSVDVNIYYQQKTAEINKYIITSTQTWGKALENAYYTLTVNKAIKIYSFSYKPDSIKFEGSSDIYYWHKQDFMPQTDFEIKIEK